MTTKRTTRENVDGEEAAPEASQRSRGLGPPNRKIYCLDLRDHADAKVYLDEIRRIVSESSVQTVDLMGWINGSPAPEQLQRYLNPVGMSH